ncbi:MAG: hypothetical protein A3C50_03085 [Candidatus Staskawiczbacteria bacterium RIFCSPHIGHO2_02_FULL_43_16]|uniref:Toxin YoeB n=1 Tax=Candidatus Staskawiczbacteria bacterium RIFCSPHIGHO2_01_FULL_41_41 TaxID=1802203 RepID=A0A1G2HUT6_9BACT|nr:MAG: hypothetical protein A2822_02955 [Candidatus Staskawiczbacteria bacterium RIFCSPHIGHO2_01_FULL_41_41]OGZ68687.1 MAG: hypothetical protein A3C50_03085 [Candidatus Staskawiczbacteria bacterium RIFCSPHIGHO2_02_FULL_43_16]OGZ75150.1 MAG: hypothetical protein A3A12_01015 [Candidatus Staskawiczbacteria bacterium RIFCSPLOWO2_01_FULL_43_17b]
MIRVVFHPKFRKFAKKLPQPQADRLAVLIETLQEDPFHSSLHTKKLGGELAGLFSFRITRDWRVLFKFIEDQTIQLLRIDHRKDVYR